MAAVFISHASQDNEKVEIIVQKFNDAGIDSFFLDYDEYKGIKLGEDYRHILYNNIKESKVLILILTQSWINSKWCFVEYHQAHSLGKTIIPIIAEEGVESKADRWIDRYHQKADLVNDSNALDKLVNRIQDLTVETKENFEWNKERSPYPGLSSFEESDAKIFFGRESETDDIIEKLNAMRSHSYPKFLNIVAASGMGKSSLLKAAVIPKVKNLHSCEWKVLPTIRPTKSPLAVFAQILARLSDREQDSQAIYQSLQEESYKKILDELYAQINMLSEHKSLLIPIDQSEELYSVADQKEREYFFRSLSYLCEEKSDFFTVWTLRADYVKYLQKDKLIIGLLDVMDIYSLAPLKQESINRIIKGPASLIGIAVEDELIERLKEDVQTTDALPLLALTLKELYKQSRHTSVMTLQDYQSLAHGEERPLESIVRNKAEEAINVFRDNHKSMKALKEAFIPRIVGYDPYKHEYFKKTAVFEELPKESYPVLEALVRERLLIKASVNGQESIEIAHEALLRKWPLLNGWLEEEQEFLVGKSQLEIALTEWKKTNSKEKAYLSGIKLQKGTSWLLEYPDRMTEEERNYIRESMDYSNKQELRKKQLLWFVFTIVLMFGLYGWYQSNVANMNLEQAIKNEQVANDRLDTIESQKNDLIASYWVMMLYDDVKDGKVDKAERLSTILKYLEANATRKDHAINVLSSYFSKKGLNVEFEEKELNTFDKLFTNLVFRKGEYVAVDLTSSLSHYIWLLNDEKIDTLSKLLNTLLSDDLPMIFQRYKEISQEDRETFQYIILMLKFVKEPSKELLEKLLQYDMFKNAPEYSVFSGFESLLQFEVIFRHAWGDKYAQEFSKEFRRTLTNQVLDKIIKTSRVLYRHALKHPSQYTEKELSSIKNQYFYGIFDIVSDDNSTKNDSNASDLLPVMSQTNIGILYESWDIQGARKEIDYIVSVQSDNYWALSQKLYLLFIENRRDEYIALIEELREKFPTQEEYITRKLKAFDVIWQNNTSLKLSDEDNKFIFDYYGYLASYHASIKKYDESVMLLEQSLHEVKGIPTQDIVTRHGNLAWYKLFVGDYQGAIRSAKEALTLDPKRVWVLTNLAHAYLLSGDVEKAKTIYFENKGMNIGSNTQVWEKVILDDFSIFREHNITNPHYEEIEKKMSEWLKGRKNWLTGKKEET